MMTVVLLLIAVLVFAWFVVFVLALCVAAGRADALQAHALELRQREGVSCRGGAPLRGARDRRRTARPGSPERRRRPRLSV
jgi:hypothetical protein